MDKKISMGSKMIDLNEYVKIQCNINDGSRTRVLKEDMIKLCEAHDMKIKRTASKTEIYDLLATKMTASEIAHHFGVGVSSKALQDVFCITHQDVKRLEKFNVLKIAYYREYIDYASGLKLKAPMYSFDHILMTQEEMDQLIKDYPKGKRKPKKV